MTLQEAFVAGIKATKEAVKTDMCDASEVWDQAGVDERCYYVDELMIEIPSFKDSRGDK